MTIHEIVKLMRRCDEDCILVDNDGRRKFIRHALKEHGATPQQAARAARRLGWAADTESAWDDLKAVN